MRWLLGFLAAAVTITSLAVSAPPANAQSCHALWVERNSYYKEAGYCFQTARAIRFFGNAGCYITNQNAVPLSPGVRRRIAQIVALERRLGCPR
jgi:hypothetical protein